MANFDDIQCHYDNHDKVFLEVLDPDYLAYSTGHWDDAADMKGAQEAKFAYLARKIGLASRRRVLEIGCGWGSFAKYCHLHYPNVECVGLTMSQTQKAFVEARPWPNFRCVLSDWRDFSDPMPFDAIVAIESLEHFATMEEHRRKAHVGVYRDFFLKCAELSAPDAPLYVQSSIVRAAPDDVQGFRDARFILNKVFPGSALATISSVQIASHGIYEFEEMILRGADMIRTLEVWRRSLHERGACVKETAGANAYDFFARYFDASIRRFARGHVDLLELTLARQRLL